MVDQTISASYATVLNIKCDYLSPSCVKTVRRELRRVDIALKRRRAKVEKDTTMEEKEEETAVTQTKKVGRRQK